MKIIEQGFSVSQVLNGFEILKQIEDAGRTCYKSEDLITDDSCVRFAEKLINNKHEAMLEHVSVTVRAVTDRGVSHEIVRHRIASYAQESTRYCNYSKGKFGNEITVIKPVFWADDSDEYCLWHSGCLIAEEMYLKLLSYGASPQEARSVLPNSLKTEIVMTMNLREWRHFFELRALGTAGKPHPQMRALAISILNYFVTDIPIIFDDIYTEVNRHG